jgi:predicted DNA-binding transcriptional regulator AlpA
MPTETTDTALLIDGGEVCGRLSIGKSTLHKLIRSGRFPVQPIRISKCVRYRADELARWIELGCPNVDRWRAMQAMVGRGRGAA